MKCSALMIAAALAAMPIAAEAQAYCFTVGQCDEQRRELERANQPRPFGTAEQYLPQREPQPQFVPPYNSATAPLMPGITPQGFSRY